ncbi:MAG: hypothetical protein Q4F49_01950 [Pseudoxanthomonas suwonensis]|nr:hypothetical protein [Pseudoxanthomonas suwonensis]
MDIAAADAGTRPTHAPSSAELLLQARDAALAGDAGADFHQDPLADRPSAHAHVADGRFTMRQRLSAADVVAGAGQMLFGGSPDPCPEIRADIARHHGIDGNRERLDEALRRHRAGRCR